MMMLDHQQSDIALHMEYENHYTVSEFALIMHMHPQTIRRAIKFGRIIAFRVGISKKATYRIAESEIDRLKTMGFDETCRLYKRRIETGRITS